MDPYGMQYAQVSAACVRDEPTFSRIYKWNPGLAQGYSKMNSGLVVIRDHSGQPAQCMH